MLIYSDTPSEIIKMLNALDFSRIPENQKPAMMDQLEILLKKYEKYIPLRTEKGNFITLNILGSPDRLANIINKYHWSKIGFTYKSLAIPFIKIWFKNNLPIKTGANL